MSAHRFVAVAACGLMAASLGSAQPTDPHLPIPAGFDFPADEPTLLQFGDRQDMAAIRRHAWMVFAGMTQRSPGGEAIWETWWPVDQTFALGALPQGGAGRRPRFRRPRQLTEPGAATPLAAGVSQLSFVLFNPATHKYIRDNKLYLSKTLDGLRAQDAGDIPDAPRDAMSIKTVWWPVAQEQLTPLPVWDAEPVKPIDRGRPRPAPNDVGNVPATWKRVVAVDARRSTIPPGETATVRFFNPDASDPQRASKIDRPGAHVVPLDSFYHFTLTQADITRSKALLDSMFNDAVGRGARAGDSVALVCMHYTTKEIKNWVWSTFWWHDRPDAGDFAAQRPAEVAGAWRNYLMDATFSTDTPKESDGTAKVVFNPWLEAGFSNGLKSNCMTCHQRAVWPARNFLPVTRGGMAPGDPYFKGVTRLDFLWSIAFESGGQ